MKLAEALQERADLNRQIEQLRSRLSDNALVQEGEMPSEDPAELKSVLDGSLARLVYLITRINQTNSATEVEGKTLTELIAEKDILSLSIDVYKSVVREAQRTTYRARNSEIKILRTISVRDWQDEIDDMAMKLRRLDNLLQETNWKTELME